METTPMARSAPAALLALVLGLVLTACGGSGTSTTQATAAGAGTTSSATASSATAAGPLALAAAPSGQLAFTRSSLSAKAGTVTIRFTNTAPEGHNLTIQQGTNGPVIAATPTFQGGTRTLSVHLRPGTYTFFCSVAGHRMAGMQGTLTVR
jgi:plastocyanin